MPLGRRKILTGECDQHGSFPLDEVVPARFTREFLVSKDTQQIVTELERHSDGKSEVPEGLLLLGVSSGECGTDQERCLHTVFRGLEDEDPSGALELFRVLGKGWLLLFEHIEVLANGHLAAHAIEVTTSPTRRRAVGGRVAGRLHQFIRPRLQKVAEQDRAGETEVIRGTTPTVLLVHRGEETVGGRAAAAGIRAIDDIVMDQRRSVEQLQCARCVEHGAELCRHFARDIERPDRTVPEGRELSPEPFAAGQKPESLVEDWLGVSAKSLQITPMVREGIGDPLLYKACESCRFVHTTSLAAAATRRLIEHRFHYRQEGAMALSEHEQRLLDEMERGFYRSEADVLQTASTSQRRVNYRSLVLGIIVAVVGIGVLIGGVAAQQLWLGLIGFAIMLGGVMLMLSRSSEAEVATEDLPQGRAKESRESFSERMERRWDERMGGER